MKLLKELSRSDIKFNKIRKTSSGSKLIDVDCEPIQTCWCKIVYDVDFSICTDVPELLEEKIKMVDNKILDHCSEVLDICHQELSDMYRSLLKPKNGGFYFRMPVNSSSILFGPEKNYHKKSEMKKVLKKNYYIRFIFKIKKISFKDYNLKPQLELIQAEYAF